jgi:hypothetical protein
VDLDTIEHTTTVKCNQYKHGDLKGTDNIVVTAADAYGNISKGNTSGDYKKAIDHRNARHTLKINKLKTRASFSTNRLHFGHCFPLTSNDISIKKWSSPRRFIFFQ